MYKNDRYRKKAPRSASYIINKSFFGERTTSFASRSRGTILTLPVIEMKKDRQEIRIRRIRDFQESNFCKEPWVDVRSRFLVDVDVLVGVVVVVDELELRREEGA